MGNSSNAKGPNAPGWEGSRCLIIQSLHFFFMWIMYWGGSIIFSFFYCSSRFFCEMNFIVLFPFLIKYYHIMSIVMVFRLGSDKLISCLFYSLSQGISFFPGFLLGRSLILLSFPGDPQGISCFFPWFLIFSPKGSVTGCDSLLGKFYYSQVYFLSHEHINSGYNYYDYVVIDVPRPMWFA